jgi:hypothetical protein
MTDTELRLIAGAAIIGESSISKNEYGDASGKRNAEQVVDEGEGEVRPEAAHDREAAHDAAKDALDQRDPRALDRDVGSCALAIPTFAPASADASLMPSPAEARRIRKRSR